MIQPLRALLLSSLAVALAASPADAAGLSFASYASYDTGSGIGPGPAPVSTVAADFTGDGSPDVASVSNFGQAESILMPNNGNGTFGSPRAISGTNGSQSLAAGDVDGDGDIDIVGMSPSSAVVVGNDGSGHFSVKQTLSLSLGAQIEAILTDADADGDLDIVAQTFGSIQTRLNNGTGTFTTGPTTQTPGGYFVSAITAAKVDDDGIGDLFAVDGASGTIMALRGSHTGSYTVSGQLAGGGLVPEDVAAVDLNRDGIDDVAAIGSFSFTLSTGLSNGSGGFLGSVATLQDGGPGPTSLGVGDFNKDGHNDLVISNLASPAPKLRVHANNGTVQPTLSGQFAVGSLPQNPAIADYNRDGRLDIATAGPGKLYVLLNTTS
ncbi:MAG: VCBS repeat-containing protein [Aeromicrobium sp.]